MKKTRFLELQEQRFVYAIQMCDGREPDEKQRSRIDEIINEYSAKWDALSENKGKSAQYKLGFIGEQSVKFTDFFEQDNKAFIMLKQGKKQYLLPLLDIFEGRDEIKFIN